jgi:hypothetical protein
MSGRLRTRIRLFIQKSLESEVVIAGGERLFDFPSLQGGKFWPARPAEARARKRLGLAEKRTLLRAEDSCSPWDTSASLPDGADRDPCALTHWRKLGLAQKLLCPLLCPKREPGLPRKLHILLRTARK